MTTYVNRFGEPFVGVPCEPGEHRLVELPLVSFTWDYECRTCGVSLGVTDAALAEELRAAWPTLSPDERCQRVASWLPQRATP